MGEKDCHIIGLCADAKYDRIQRTVEPTMYFSHRQAALSAACVQVRTARDPLSLVPAIRRIVADVDPSMPVYGISTQTQLLKRSIMPERLFAILCSALAVLGIALSCVGLYGLLAFTVTRRTGEIGVRMALGARPRDIAWPVLRSALWLAAFGLLVGIPAALALTRVLRSVLFGVTPHDPLTITASALLILAVATLAAWLPARRAAKVDPMEALRHE
jgi:ABC-type antimicrobial peptide transport system permease subunit